jgi:general secretion pathway protein D
VVKYVRKIVWVVFLCACMAGAEDARSLAKGARKAERKGDWARAYMLYSQAAAVAPNNRDYWARSQALRTRALQEVKVEAAAMPPEAARPAADVESVTGTITAKELAEARKPQPPKQLQGNPGRRDLDFRGNFKNLFEKVSHVYGLDVVFDGDYPDGSELRFRMDQADYREALRTLEIATGSFVVPLTGRLMLVAKDNVVKRNEVEPMAAVVIPIPEPVSVQDAQELARTVQQTFEIRRFFVDSQRRMVFLRDRVSKIEGAQMLFTQLLRHRPEVEIEVEFIEVSRKASSSYGLSLPTSFPLVNTGKLWRKATPYFPSGFASYIPFGGGASLFAIGIGSASAVANASRSEGSVLLRAGLRALEGQAAEFHVGDKYPIITSSYGNTGTPAGSTVALMPSITFEDLGLVLKITPRIHGAEDITMDVDAEFKILTGESLNDIPVIANRKLKSQVRLSSGEYAIVAGLMNTSEARTISGLAGISSLPWLGLLLRQNTRENDTSEAVIVIRPRVISLPGSERPTKAFWTGSETRYPSPL